MKRGRIAGRVPCQFVPIGDAVAVGVAGAFSPDSLSLRGDAQFNDNNAVGLNSLAFADAGPDGAITWAGSDARIQVSPLDNTNADGYVRIINVLYPSQGQTG